MLQDIVHMEASCVTYDEIGTLNRLEQSKFCVLTVTTLGIARPTIQLYMMFRV